MNRWIVWDENDGWQSYDTIEEARQWFDQSADQMQPADEDTILFELVPHLRASMVPDGGRYVPRVTDLLADEHATLVARLRRAERILAVERGDSTQAPEGWRLSTGESWCPGDGVRDCYTHRLSRGRWPWVSCDARGRRRGHGECATALEAMEAADAAWQAAQVAP